MNNDLDARVAALMTQAQIVASAWSLVGGPFDFGQALQDHEIQKAEMERMIRTELQKPALHELVTDEETDKALQMFNVVGGDNRTRIRRTLSHFLQGRAQPAPSQPAAPLHQTKQGAEIRFLNLEADIRRVLGWERPICDFEIVKELQEALERGAEQSQPAAQLNAEEAIELAKWRLLLDPNILHANLVAGQPAKLTHEHLLHLLGTDAQPAAPDGLPEPDPLTGARIFTAAQKQQYAAAPVELPVVAWLAWYQNPKDEWQLYTTSTYELAVENDDTGKPEPLVKLSDAQAAIAAAGRKAS